MMGLAFDSACILWQPLVTTCGDRADDDDSGSCILYDNKQLATNLLILTCTVKALSVVAAVVAAVLYRPPSVIDVMVEEVKSAEVDCDKSGECRQSGDEAVTMDETETSDNTVAEVAKTEQQADAEKCIEKTAADEKVKGGFSLVDEIEMEQCSSF